MLKCERMILERGVAVGEGEVPQMPRFGHEDETGQPEFSCQGYRDILIDRRERGDLPLALQPTRKRASGMPRLPAPSAPQQPETTCH